MAVQTSNTQRDGVALRLEKLPRAAGPCRMQGTRSRQCEE